MPFMSPVYDVYVTSKRKSFLKVKNFSHYVYLLSCDAARAMLFFIIASDAKTFLNFPLITHIHLSSNYADTLQSKKSSKNRSRGTRGGKLVIFCTIIHLKWVSRRPIVFCVRYARGKIEILCCACVGDAAQQK